jgi:hypothetical protein
VLNWRNLARHGTGRSRLRNCTVRRLPDEARINETRLLLAISLILGLLVGSPGYALAQAQYRSFGGVVLPDPEFTPGNLFGDLSMGEMCTAGTAADRRDVPDRVKRAVYALYRVQPRPGVCCEVDHLIALSLGGSNDMRNLWPQPYEPRPGAHEKDVLENFLHRAVCSQAMKLGAAQRAIATNWIQAYRQMRGHTVLLTPSTPRLMQSGGGFFLGGGIRTAFTGD